MNMIKTFTPEEIAVIAEDKDRVSSANDLFVRYEDHMAALIASQGDNAPIRLPSASSKPIEETDE